MTAKVEYRFGEVYVNSAGDCVLMVVRQAIPQDGYQSPLCVVIKHILKSYHPGYTSNWSVGEKQWRRVDDVH